MPDQATRGICFVVMGFGKKTDFESGRTLDLDKTYKDIIKPAAEAARLECVRADEIVHSGLIDLPMYEQLLTADVVVADLSTSNKNAFYELGVRHALRPHTTIVIAEDGMKAFPFDVNHVLVRQYHHLGEDIGYSEVLRFRDQVTQAMNEILDSDPRKNDSPVYTILHGLTPPRRAEETRSKGDVSREIAPPAPQPGGGGSAPSYNTLIEQVDEAEDAGDFIKATTLLGAIRGILKTADPNRPEDPTLVQRHAFATYKSEHPSPMEAYSQASEILKVLNPETSNDPETLGLWGAVQKRFWNETQDRYYLDQAVRAYRRGFYLRNDYYNGINYAYLLNVRGINPATRAEAIADFVEAMRIRREVLLICEALLEEEQVSEANQYWVRVTMAEAYLGIEDEENCKRKLEEAEAFSPFEWMRKTTNRRLEDIRGFLAQSPLKEL
jgi:tetratricopeptide (TPR) repeat protein